MPFQIIRNDITKVKADAIVNTANPEPICADGTDRAVYEAAGKEKLLAERRRIGSIARGEAAVTPAFDLPAKYIIHTVGPVWLDGGHGEFDTLRACYENSLNLALQLKCRSIAFPLIATGVYGFPKDKALQIAMSVIQPFVMEHSMKVILVVFDRKAFELSGKVVENVREYVDANYVEKAHRKEYSVGIAGNRRAFEAPGYYRSAPRIAQIREENACFAAYADTAYADENAAYADETTADADEDAAYADKTTADADENAAYVDETTAYADEDAAYVDENLGNVAETTAYAGATGLMDEATPVGNSQPPLLAKRSVNKKKIDINELLASSEKTFQEKLFEIIDRRGLTGPQVYKNYISKQVFSKIQSDKDYHPNKSTAIALCLSLHLNLEETKDLIGRAGWTLSPSSKADLVIAGCIMNEEYDLVDVNIILFEFDCPQLEKIK